MVRNSSRVGRKDATERIRELVALLGSLSRTGDTVSLDAISKRLGISHADAAAMMDIVCQASGEETSGLLISANDDFTEFTLQYPEVHGMPIRLTAPETMALFHALDQVGMEEDDPVRVRLGESLASHDVKEQTVRRSLGSMGPQAPGSLHDVLLCCAQAQVDQRELVFAYQGLRDEVPRTRHAAIRHLSSSGEAWYATAIDLVLGEERSFRTDRMANVRLGEPLGDRVTQDLSQDDVEADPSQTRMVRLLVTDESYLTILDWPGLDVIQRDADGLLCEIPYYGSWSTWLVRRIAACGGAVVAYDNGIMDAVRTYIASELG